MSRAQRSVSRHARKHRRRSAVPLYAQTVTDDRSFPQTQSEDLCVSLCLMCGHGGHPQCLRSLRRLCHASQTHTGSDDNSSAVDGFSGDSHDTSGSDNDNDSGRFVFDEPADDSAQLSDDNSSDEEDDGFVELRPSHARNRRMSVRNRNRQRSLSTQQSLFSNSSLFHQSNSSHRQTPSSDRADSLARPKRVSCCCFFVFYS